MKAGGKEEEPNERRESEELSERPGSAVRLPEFKGWLSS